MGQELMNPPSVEGWHEGAEWIDSGALVERINFAAKYLGDVTEPGVRDVIDRLASSNGGTLTPEDLVDGCSDLAGPVSLKESTRRDIIDHVAVQGDVSLRGHVQGDESERRVADVLKLIASSREFQVA
jgi:hypothetical protein